MKTGERLLGYGRETHAHNLPRACKPEEWDALLKLSGALEADEHCLRLGFVFAWVYHRVYRRSEETIMVMAAHSRRENQKTVKAFESDIALINEQARLLGCTAAEVIHDLCSVLRRHRYLQELGESFDVLRENAENYTAFQAEQKAWETTLADGLDDAS